MGLLGEETREGRGKRGMVGNNNKREERINKGRNRVRGE